MIALLRALVRLLTFLVLVALAAAGLAAAVFSIGGSGDLSLPGLADLLRLPALETEVGSLLDDPVEFTSGLAGLAAILLGALLLIGALAPARERLLLLRASQEGKLQARRRAFGQVASTIVEQNRAVSGVKVKVRPSRRGRGGRMSVRAMHPASADPAEIRRAADAALTPLAEAFELQARVRPHLDGGRRVQ
ncbi:MAG: hypothetical protein WKF29_05435 [Thermoleophilaceae bacterium]